MKPIARWQRLWSHSTAAHLHRAQQTSSSVGSCGQTRHVATYRRQRKMLNIAPSATHGGSPVVTGSSGRSRSAQQPLPDSSHIIFDPPPSAPNVYHTPPKFLPREDLRRKLVDEEHQRFHTDRATLTASSSTAPPPFPASSTASAELTTLPSTPSPTAFPSRPMSLSKNKPTPNPASWSSSTSTAPTSHQEPDPELQDPMPAAPVDSWAEAHDLPPLLRQFQAKRYHLGPEQIEEIRRLRTEDERTYTRGKLAQMFNCSPMFIGIIVHASKERRIQMKKKHERIARNWARNGTVSMRTRAERKKRKESWAFDS